MPSGETHLKGWIVGWGISAPTSIFIYSQYPVIGISTMAGYSLGLILDNDADQIAITKSESRALKIPVLGWVWVGYWTMYGAIFRRMHRSFWTHFPGVSTGIRLIYLFLPLTYFLYTGKIIWKDWYSDVIFGLWIGLSISDGIHWLFDLFVKDKKKDD